MASAPNFETTFAVPLSCKGCVDDVSKSLYKLPGIQAVTADLDAQLISIKGSAAPSKIVSTIQSTGRDAILRGTGKADSAAVCILETHADGVTSPVKGLVRMVEVSNSVTLADITVRGLLPGTYHCTLRESGNISQGPEMTGNMFSTHDDAERGYFGALNVDQKGQASAFVDRPIAVSDMIGRSMVVAPQSRGPFSKNDTNTIVGVVARSAGVWDNDKTVCSCSGKTVWEERQEQIHKGML